MILQVGYGAMIKEKTNGSGVAIDPFQVFFFKCCKGCNGSCGIRFFPVFFLNVARVVNTLHLVLLDDYWLVPGQEQKSSDGQNFDKCLDQFGISWCHGVTFHNNNFTPLTIKDWKLKITHLQRKIIWMKHPWQCNWGFFCCPKCPKWQGKPVGCKKKIPHRLGQNSEAWFRRGPWLSTGRFAN